MLQFGLWIDTNPGEWLGAPDLAGLA